MWLIKQNCDQSMDYYALCQVRKLKHQVAINSLTDAHQFFVFISCFHYCLVLVGQKYAVGIKLRFEMMVQLSKFWLVLTTVHKQARL